MPLYSKARERDMKACNRAVIVSVGQFDPGVGLSGRVGGVRNDTRRLHRVLTTLGFKVEFHNDQSADEIYELFEEGTVQKCC